MLDTNAVIIDILLAGAFFYVVITALYLISRPIVWILFGNKAKR